MDPRIVCPFCQHDLRGGDTLDRDANGAPFKICPHCSRQVAMEELPTLDGTPAAFIVARKQE